MLCGDALGAPFEGQSVIEESRLGELEHGAPSLRYTDDSALAFTLAEHLAEHRGIQQDELAREFAATWRREPWHGYGASTARTFELIEAGGSWRHIARDAFDGAGSLGNGAAMRVAPVALLATNPRHAAELARRGAELTHAHEDGVTGAVCQAAAVTLAMRAPDSPLVAERFLAALPVPTWRERLEGIARLVAERPAPGRAAELLGNGVRATESVPAALLAFLLWPDDPAAAIRYAVHMAGDTDTIAAMAGAIAGARRTEAGLPANWLSRVEGAERARRIAERLARIAPVSGESR